MAEAAILDLEMGTTDQASPWDRYLRTGAMWTVSGAILAGSLMSVTGTSDAVELIRPGTGWWQAREEPAGESFVGTPSTAERVEGLKISSGLTWSQLAALFGVSRRAVHHWVQGGNMTAANVARLDGLQLRLSEHMFAAPQEAKSWLFQLESDGRSRYATWVSEVYSPSVIERVGTLEQQLEGAQPAAYIAQELATVKRERIRLVDE